MEKTVLHRPFLCLILSGLIEFLKGNTVSSSRVRPASADIGQNFCLLPAPFSGRSRASEKRGGKKNSVLCNKSYSFRLFFLRTAPESRFWTGNRSGWLHIC